MEVVRIYEYLGENNLFPEDVRVTYDDLDEKEYTVISINWGDWKHEHWKCDYLMEEAGYKFVGAITTDEDGSDCYSADRYYEWVA